MESKTVSSLPPATRVFLSLLLPVAGALLFSLLITRKLAFGSVDQGEVAVQLSGAALLSWFVGLRWYGLRGMGLRGGRPLYAGIGFAVLGWLVFLAVRWATVEVSSYGSPDSGRTFIFLLLFEAFCVQLWIFGFFFRGVAEWRGPLTAAISSGIVFAAVAYLFFQESIVGPGSTLLYFYLLYLSAWGILFGLIRLRSGSVLGPVIVQAMQSWTAWQLLAPMPQPEPSQLRTLYLVSAALFAILIWRLWPKRIDDYRV